jgi:hypothetical protein
MTMLADPGTRQRLEAIFLKLIWDQIRPWAYMDTDGLQVTRFDGQPLVFTAAMLDGLGGAPRAALWEGYIEPFLEQICRTEVDAAAGLPASQRADLRAGLVAGIRRVYATMVEIDWHLRGDGDPEHLEKRDSVTEEGRMVAFVDARLGEAGLVRSR